MRRVSKNEFLILEKDNKSIKVRSQNSSSRIETRCMWIIWVIWVHGFFSPKKDTHNTTKNAVLCRLLV